MNAGYVIGNQRKKLRSYKSQKEVEMKKKIIIATLIMLIGACSFLYSRETIPKELTLVKETDNSLIYIRETDQDVKDMVEIISSEFENHYRRLTELFQYSPSQKTSIVIFTDKEQFHHYIGRDTEGTYDADDKIIKVYTPSDLSRIDIRNEYTSQVVHEFVHAIIQQINPDIGGVKWLDEGTAFFAAEQLQAEIQSKRYAYLSPPDLSKFMDSQLYFEEEGGIAYYFSGLLVKYIYEEFGKENFNKVLRDPLKIEDILNKSIEEIYTEWSTYTVELYQL